MLTNQNKRHAFGHLTGIITLILSLLVPICAPAESFTLGIINERPDTPEFALKQYDLVHKYLREQLADHALQVNDLVIARGLEEMLELIRQGKVDALIEGVMPTLFLERHTRSLEPELLAWRKGQRQYYSVFFVRKDSTSSC